MRKLKNEELDRLSIDEFKQHKKLPVILVLDNVRSLNNVGSAFRTADAFLLTKIYLCGITGTPPHREINKTALGSTDSVEWAHVPDTHELMGQLKQEGIVTLALEQTDNSSPLQAFKPDPRKKYALVFGNEVFGVGDKVIAQVDHCLEIPQFGTKHSLNISVSIGITVWDFFCKLGPSY